MITKDSINQIISSYLNDTDYYLVDLKLTADNRITIEIDSFDGVSIGFCAELNKHIESQLDREEEDYELEVSSAGLTSPLKVAKQYEKNLGNEVEVLSKNGQKFSGVLTEFSDQDFTIEIEKKVKLEGAKRKSIVLEPMVFSYDEVKSTKYIFRFK